MYTTHKVHLNIHGNHNELSKILICNLLLLFLSWKSESRFEIVSKRLRQKEKCFLDE